MFQMSQSSSDVVSRLMQRQGGWNISPISIFLRTRFHEGFFFTLKLLKGFENILAETVSILFAHDSFLCLGILSLKSFHLIPYQQIVYDAGFNAPNNKLNIKGLLDHIWYCYSKSPLVSSGMILTVILTHVCVGEIDSTKWTKICGLKYTLTDFQLKHFS